MKLIVLHIVNIIMVFVGKGVFLRTLELYTGGIGDSNYVRKSKMLEEQDKFAKDDTPYGVDVVMFTNVFDKGYRVVLDCLKMESSGVGSQFLLEVMRGMGLFPQFSQLWLLILDQLINDLLNMSSIQN